VLFSLALLFKMSIKGVNKMLKEDILIEANQQGISLTDSQFRRYIHAGLFQSTKLSNGKGKGVISHYPENSLEVLFEIQKAKKFKISTQDMIFILFSKGYIVDVEKLTQNLLKSVESMVQELELLISYTEDETQRDWVIEHIVEENIPRNIPGRPRIEDMNKLEVIKVKEKYKFLSVIQFIGEIFKAGKLTSETSNQLMNSLGYSPQNPRITFSKEWMEPYKWSLFIRKSTKEDTEEVQHIFKLLRMYEKYLMEEKIDSFFYDTHVKPFMDMYKNAGINNFLRDSKLLKLVITLFLINPEWRKQLIGFFSLNGHIQTYEELVHILPHIFVALDKQLEGGNGVHV
jgi:hypothetical protein